MTLARNKTDTRFKMPILPPVWSARPLVGREFCHDCLDSLDYPRQAAVVECAGRIGGLVVIRITERSRVRDHDPRIALPPEGPLIGPPDSVDGLGRRHS